MTKLRDKLAELKARFEKAGIENPRLNAELILAHIHQFRKTDLYLKLDQDCKNPQLIEEFALPRKQGKPLQYILGETEFYGCRIELNKSVLIPRPETEILVEKIINENSAPKQLLEIGTGSGCIAIALKKNYPNSIVTAVDISRNALQTAKNNARINNTKIDFFQSDLFENISGKFDLIISNPPYISKSEFEKIPAEIRNYEPQNALLAEEDGLYFYRKILEKAKDYLTLSGKIYFEIGYDQAERISQLARKCGFDNIEIEKDLNGFDRVMKINNLQEFP